MSENLIEKTSQWFVAAGQQPAKPEPNAAQIAFYIGMQLEELAEKLEALKLFTGVPEIMQKVSAEFKRGDWTGHIQHMLSDPGIMEAMLDADMDLLWVSIGAARAQGADVSGAYEAVTEANWDKFIGGVATLHPETGKVLKRPGWVAPNLAPYTYMGQE